MLDIPNIGLGMTISLLGWLLFIFFILPHMLRKTKTEIIQDVKAETPKMVKQVVPEITKELTKDLETNLDTQRAKIITEIRKEIPDIKSEFTAQVPKLIDDLKKELPEIGDTIFVNLFERVTDPSDEDMQLLLKTFASEALTRGFEIYRTDPEMQKRFNGFLTKQSDIMMKGLQTKIENFAGQFGVNMSSSPDMEIPTNPPGPGQPLTITQRPGPPIGGIDPGMMQKVMGWAQLAGQFKALMAQGGP